ncbi:MAG: 30S ribosomal protein S3 [Candidatus Nanohaloarchaea archaeon]
MREKEFIEKGARKVRLHEFLQDELEGAGYSHSEIVRTPTSTKMVIYAQRPGLVIGRGGSRIKELTEKTEKEFDFENPQIEVNEIEEPDADAQVVAKSMASWLEKGGRSKRVGYTYLRRMKEAGVIGAEIEITGKLSGNRGRTEKFSFGYVKRCGNTSKKNVDHGYALARTKPGTIGVKVRIMKDMPDFLHRDVEVEEELLHETVDDDSPKVSRIGKIIEEAENMTASEIERAIEELEEVQTADITTDEVREVFETGAHEEIEEEEETSEEPETEEAPEEEEVEETDDSEEVEDIEEPEEVDYDEIIGGTISDAKDMIRDLDSPDWDALLEAEEDGKARKTFISWLEDQKK